MRHGTRPFALLGLAVLFVPLVVAASRDPRAAPHVAPRADAEAIVARTLKAMGGEARLRAIKTLRLDTITTPMAGSSAGLEIVYDFTRPNLERKEVRGRVLIEYDGTRISVQTLDPTKPPQPPRFEPPEKNQDFEIEIGFFIPAFLDYQAAYLGTADVAGRRCHQLRVNLPLGPRLTYAVDASTYLIAKVRAEVPADGGFTFWSERTWSDYRAVEGVRYPHVIVSANRDGSSTRTLVRSADINGPHAREKSGVVGQDWAGRF
jgi:hypothetical protein